MGADTGRCDPWWRRSQSSLPEVAGFEPLSCCLPVGTLKLSGPGTQIKSLGGGAEGVVHTVIGAKDAPTEQVVRKTYDRGGPLCSKEMLARKMDAGRALRGNEDFAALKSKKLGKGKKGGRFTLHENVPGGKEGSPIPPESVVKGVQALHGRGGVHLTDVTVNTGNYLTTPDGKTKIIDYLPVSKNKLEQIGGGAHPWMRKAQREMGIKLRSAKNTGEHAVTGAARAEYAAQGLKIPGKKLIPDYGTHGGPKSLAYKPSYGAKAQAKQMRDLTGSNTTASDYTAPGLRRASYRRSLEGLGGGSTQTRKLRK